MHKLIVVKFVCIIWRYAYPWWKEKEIDSVKKRNAGLCPLTPEETALVLRALDIDRNIQVYIAAGEIYKAEKRMASLKEAFPNLVWTLNPPQILASLCILYMVFLSNVCVVFYGK